MIDSDIELKLLANSAVDVGNGLRLHIPTLKEIIDIGSKNYDGILSILLANKDSFEDLPVDEFTNFEFFYMYCIHNNDSWSKAKAGFELLFKMEPELDETPEEPFICFNGDLSLKIDNSNFDYFQSLLIYSHNISLEKDEYNPANDAARELIERLQVGKQEILSKKEQIFDLASKISGIAWKSNAVNIFNVFDMNIYQFHDAVLRLEQVDNYLFTLQGIYSGNVDGKKIKMSDLHWSRKYKGV